MTKSELKELIKESLQEILFDSRVIETLMVEVISKVENLRENTGMSAGTIEAPVAKDEFDLEQIEDEPKDALVENIASFWGRQLGGDPAFRDVKIAARGKSYTPTEQSSLRVKDDPAMAGLRKAASLKIGGMPIFTEENFVGEESNVRVDEDSLLGSLFGSDKLQRSFRIIEEEAKEKEIAMKEAIERERIAEAKKAEREKRNNGN